MSSSSSLVRGLGLLLILFLLGFMRFSEQLFKLKLSLSKLRFKKFSMSSFALSFEFPFLCKLVGLDLLNFF